MSSRFIKGPKLKRRTFLRGAAGIAVGLPVLEAMLDNNGNLPGARAQSDGLPRRYAVLFAGQAAFYAAALAGWLLERAGARVRVLSLPHYFVLANLAAVIAFYKFARGERYARWEPIREPAAPV